MAFKKCSVLLKRGEEGSPKCFDDAGKRGRTFSV
jgi:hypothetical protein